MNKDHGIDHQIDFIRSKKMSSNIEREKVSYRKVLENLLEVKRWNENPQWQNVDVVKVIEDLLVIVKECTPRRGDDFFYRHEIQNAEAALGMLQAFKSENGSIGTPLVKMDKVEVPPLKDGKLQKI